MTTTTTQVGRATPEDDAPQPSAPDESKSSTGPVLGRGWTVVLVLIGLALFAVLTGWLAWRASSLLPRAETQWLRSVTVWDGTIGFLSFLIGTLLGVTVQVQRVNQANKAADDAKKAAANAHTETKATRAELDQTQKQLSHHQTKAHLGDALAASVLEAVEHEKTTSGRYVPGPRAARMDGDRLMLVSPSSEESSNAPLLVADQSQAEAVPTSLAMLMPLAEKIQRDSQD